jgi:addiction module RelE/StbE family toxin
MFAPGSRRRARHPAVRVEWSGRALTDLFEIEAFISQENPTAAAEFIERLIDAGERLATHPRRGRVVPELRQDGVRELFVSEYRIIFFVDVGAVGILAVAHGKRILRANDLR